MRWILIGLGIVVLAVGGWIGWVEWKSTAISRIPFTLRGADGDFEVRHYPPLVLVSVDVTGDRQAALREGTATLDDFISGDNRSQDRIDMTRPILQDPLDETAAEALPASEDDWKVSFVMPSWFTTGTLPQPNSEAIKVAQVPSATVAAVTFSGFVGDSDMAEETRTLLAWMKEQGLAAAGPPRYAIYDPPWRLPFMRHNEVLIPIAEPQ